MIRVFLIFFAVLLLLPVATVQSAEPVPFKEFVSITENVLDALDEVEVVFSNHGYTKANANMAFKKLDIAMLKYRRYITNWRKSSGKQAAIIKAIANAHVSYLTVNTEEELKEYGKANKNEGVYGKTHKRAELYVQEARELFMKYKNSKNSNNQ